MYIVASHELSNDSSVFQLQLHDCGRHLFSAQRCARATHAQCWPEGYEWGTTIGHVIGPPCHYDVMVFVFVAKRRGCAT